MEVIKLILALIAVISLVTVIHYCFSISKNLKPIEQLLNNKIYFAFLLVGWVVISFSGVKQLLFFIPSSWFMYDEFGDTTSLRDYLAAISAFFSIVILDRINQLATAERNADFLSNQIKQLEGDSKSYLFKAQQKIYAEKEYYEEKLDRLERSLKESKSLNQALPLIYSDSSYFSYRKIRTIDQADKSWSLFDEDLTESCFSKLFSHTEEHLRKNLREKNTSINILSLLNELDTVVIKNEEKAYVYLDKTAHPLSNAISCSEDLESIISLFFFITVFPNYAYAYRMNEKVKTILTMDDYVEFWTLHKKLSHGKGENLDWPWGLRIKRCADQQIELSCMFIHEEFADLNLYKSTLRLDDGQVSSYRNDLVISHVTKFVSY